MKKALTLAMAILLIGCLSISAFAAIPAGNATASHFDATQTITVTLKDSTGETITPGSAGTLYSIEIAWSNTDLVYTYDGDVDASTLSPVWNPETHSYTYPTGNQNNTYTGSWTLATYTVEVKNHSNTNVSVTLIPAANQNGVTFTADQTTATLGSADQGEYLNDATKAPTCSFSVTASGTPTGAINTTSQLDFN